MKRRSSPPTIRSRMLPSSMPTSCSERDEVFARTPLRQSLGSRTPMPIQVLMPALSPTMEKGNLAKWIKSEGDKIKAGDVIAEIETDKATMEVEAVDDGTLGKILVPEGTADVAVNTPIAVILSDGEDASAINGLGAAAAAPKVEGGMEIKGPLEATVTKIAPAVAPPYPVAALEAERGDDAFEDAEMVTMTVREALRDAMAEEMRRDPD